MANLYIAEFKSVGSRTGGVIPAPYGVPITEQKVSFTTSTQSNHLNGQTSVIRVNVDAECHLSIGTNPTATTSNMRLIADQTEYFTIPQGSNLKIAAVTA